MKTIQIITSIIYAILHCISFGQDQDSAKNYMELVSKPIILKGSLSIEPDKEAIEIKYKDNISYYVKVKLNLMDLDKIKKHFDELANFNDQFRRVSHDGSLIVICRAIKLNDGSIAFDPIFYEGNDKNRSYELIYCPAITIDGAAPLLIVGKS